MARPGLRDEDTEVVTQLACLLWSWDAKHRQHHSNDGSVSISYQELDRRFGRRAFPQINARHQILVVSDDWSVAKHETRRYGLHPDVEGMDEGYCRKYEALTVGLTQVVTEDGRIRRSVPQAVAAKDSRGNSAKVWRKAPITSRVPVDLHALQSMAAYCARRLRSNAPLRASAAVALRRLRKNVVRIMRMAHTDIAGRGYVLLRYQESESGRLYASGLSLQNVQYEIRAAQCTA